MDDINTLYTLETYLIQLYESVLIRKRKKKRKSFIRLQTEQPIARNTIGVNERKYKNRVERILKNMRRLR